MDAVPGIVWWLAGIAIVAIAAALWDLARHEVRHLPKWAWAAIIVAVSFPFGAIVYFVAAGFPPRRRCRRDGTPPTAAPVARSHLHAETCATQHAAGGWQPDDR